MKKIGVIIRILGEVTDDYSIEQLEDCLYNNVIFDIQNFEIEDVEFMVKELEN